MQKPPQAPEGFTLPDGAEPPRKQARLRGLTHLIVGGGAAVVLVIAVLGAVRVAPRLRPLIDVMAPTATRAPSGITGATFGGLPGAFTELYGQPAADGSYTTTISSHTAHIMFDTASGADGYQHVSYLTLSVGGSGLSTSTQSEIDQLIGALLPPDAGSGGVLEWPTGYLIEFSSALLGKVFPKSFGNLHVFCPPQDPTKQQSRCIYAMNSA